MAGVKRNRLQDAPPTWAVVRGMLHMWLKDAAAELKVPISYLRRLCRQNGFATWPGKKIRRNAPWAVFAETKHEEEDDMTAGIKAPDENHPPGEELTTLNLIDRVGSS